MEELEVLDKLEVELIGHYGSDEHFACSAWTSTLGKLEGREKDVGPLVKRLWKDGHHTPFETSLLHFRMRVCQPTHKHILKHRIGFSVNAESARYRRLVAKVYIPQDLSEEGKERLLNRYKDAHFNYIEEYERQVEMGVSKARAKEIARYFLPESNVITLDVKCNMRSFLHFMGLRGSKHAQKEIRELAWEMFRLLEEIEGEPFKFTLEAWKEGRGVDF